MVRTKESRIKIKPCGVYGDRELWDLAMGMAKVRRRGKEIVLKKLGSLTLIGGKVLVSSFPGFKAFGLCADFVVATFVVYAYLQLGIFWFGLYIFFYNHGMGKRKRKC